MADFFIKRPILSICLSVIIVLLGAFSILRLPISEYPDIIPPSIQVTATYPGADCETVVKSIASPIEQQMSGVDGMSYMTSVNTNNGQMSMMILFEIGTEANMDQVLSYLRYGQATSQLPSEVSALGVSLRKTSGLPALVVSLYSPQGTYDGLWLANYAYINMVDAIKRVPGVGDVQVFGAGRYAMRIWLNPEKMAALNITARDVMLAVQAQNAVNPAGKIGAQPAPPDQQLSFTVKAPGRLTSVKEFENIVVRGQDSSIVRVGDIARVELGSETYSLSSSVNDMPAASIGIYEAPGGNAIQLVDNIKALLKNTDMPPGMDYLVSLDSTLAVRAGIEDIVSTLVIALGLVVLVVFIFLQGWRGTLIPAFAVPVSIVGAFIAFPLFGFSINTICLMGLVLAIGLVVDDAIVVVEAVQSKFDAGYKSPYLATKDAMGDVTMAIISCTCVFMAVFIPVTFMGGTSGVFYTQFGITMATAVGISMISALTLCPALCAIMMRPSDGTKSAKSINGRVRAAYNASFNAVLGKYKKGVMFFIRHRWMVWASLIAAIALLVYLMSTTKTGLVPQEDQGVIMVNVSISPGSTLDETTKVMDKLEDILRDTPEIEHYARVAGYGLISGQGTSYGTIIVRLKDWSERKGKDHSSDAVVARLNGQFYGIKEAQIFSFQPAMIPGYGMGNSLELNLQDKTGGDMETFYQSVMQFLGALNQRPEVAMAYTAYAINFPQVSVEVDAAKCKRAGISPGAVLDALGSYCGGAYISNYNQFGKVYRVMMQASPEYRLDEQSLDNMFVRNGTEMAPVSQFVTLKKVLGPETTNRFNLYSSISANVNPAEGYSSGEVQKVIEEVAEQTLPTGYGYEYGGMAREEASSGGAQTVFIYAICIFLIYLILACLYESFFVPFAVIFSVPFGLMGSFLFAKLLGLENNIYLQTGVIMLIGLLAKTAILITEYAIERRRKGMGIVESAYSAAQVRLRPILMTVLTMIFGMLPLMFSSGAGANGNSSLGTGVVGGMVVGTLALLFVVPVFYIIFEFLQEKIRPPMEEEADVQVLLEKEKSEAERNNK